MFRSYGRHSGKRQTVFNVCPGCGLYLVEREIVCPGPRAICPSCGAAQPFLQLPLFVVTGASAAGKSTLALDLVPALREEAVVLDADILWAPEFNNPQDEYRRFREVWLRLAKNIGQSGLPVVLLGTFLPDQLEKLRERRYFSALHVLGLTADDDDLIRRLRNRPAWRESGGDAFVEAMVRFNRRLQDIDGETRPIELVDTSTVGRDQTVERVVAWYRSRMAETETCVPFPAPHKG